MTWNYRVVRRRGGGEALREERGVPPASWAEPEYFYAIYEVYYDENGEPVAVTERPVWPAGDTLEELAEDVRLYVRALRKPVLDYEDIAGVEGG